MARYAAIHSERRERRDVEITEAKQIKDSKARTRLAEHNWRWRTD